MDNASKALIIAGAILIAVMLVSLGVMLYNTAAGVAESTTGTVEALGVEGFNAQFNQYTGLRKRAAVAQGLVDKVIANNANGETTIGIILKKGTGYSGTLSKEFTTAISAVTGTGGTLTNTLTELRNTITTKDTIYNISVTKYDASGAISELTIEAVNK